MKLNRMRVQARLDRFRFAGTADRVRSARRDDRCHAKSPRTSRIGLSRSSCWRRMKRWRRIWRRPSSIDLPHPRTARSEADSGFRRDCFAFRLHAGMRARSREEDPPHGPAARRPEDDARRSCCRMRISSIPSRAVPEAHGEARRQAGGADSYVSDAAVAEAGSVQGGECRPLRAGGDELYAFHFADPALSRPDRSPDFERVYGPAHDFADQDQLHVIADDCSQTERRADEAERELVEWKKAKFMEQRVGEDFDALVISVTKYGLFVELEKYFVEGLVPIDTLPDDRYTVSREYPQDHRRSVAAGVLDRRSCSRDARPRGCAGAKAAVLDYRSGSCAAAEDDARKLD